MNLRYYQKESECMPLEELKKLQGQRLAKNFRHVYENVEYYRKRCQEAGLTPDDVKGLDDLDKIPFTCKDDLRQTYPYGLFAVPMSQVVRIHASSGTTGVPKLMPLTKKYIEIMKDYLITWGTFMFLDHSCPFPWKT